MSEDPKPMIGLIDVRAVAAFGAVVAREIIDWVRKPPKPEHTK